MTRPSFASLVEALTRDEEFLSLTVGATVTFALAAPDAELAVVDVRDGSVRVGESPEFSVVLPSESWDELLSGSPTPGTQHVLAHLYPRGSGQVKGSEIAFAQHLHLVRRAIEVLAGRSTASTPTIDRTGITGRYVRVRVAPWGTCDVYVEEAGVGRPVVLLHTAGADSSQYHGLMSVRDELPGRRLIAFDLPWHGRSAPAHGRSIHDYALTSESYADCIAAVIEALELPELPILVGASMAGAAVVETAARHPEAIAGAIGCQAGPRVANRSTPWLRHPQINQALFVPEWTFGLMSPHSPKSERDRVWWGYSQGGYAVYERDIAYYSTCWDIDNVAHLLDDNTPPIVLMSGSYDYTVPPAATRELAATIAHAVYRDMPELGHFPHAENPNAFAAHLLWALQEIDRAATHHSKD